MNCFVYSLMHPHATGLCSELLLNIGIIGHSLFSQTIGKVAQTNQANRSNTQHKKTKTTKPNKTKLAMIQIAFYTIRPGDRFGLFYTSPRAYADPENWKHTREGEE